MELGHYGWNRKVDIFQQHAVFLDRPAPATSNYGVLNIGDNPFDGTSPGAFHGDSGGTCIAINAPSSFAGDALNIQKQGVNYFSINSLGIIYANRDPVGTASYGILSLGTQYQSGAGQFVGDSGGTYIAINAPTSFAGDAINIQKQGVNYFSINSVGIIYANRNPVSTASYGILSLGTQYQSGVGQFAGDNNGTYIAINAPSGFSGNFIDAQANAVKMYKLDASGNETLAGTLTAGANAAPFPLTNSITKKASDSTMTSNTAFVDGPTVSCVAGTWLLIACCTVVCGTTAGTLTGKLWDGTTVICSAETRQVASQASSITLAGVVSPGSTTTYKMSVATTTGATNASTLKAAAVNNGAGNNATWITAARIG